MEFGYVITTVGSFRSAIETKQTGTVRRELNFLPFRTPAISFFGCR